MSTGLSGLTETAGITGRNSVFFAKLEEIEKAQEAKHADFKKQLTTGMVNVSHLVIQNDCTRKSVITKQPCPALITIKPETSRLILSDDIQLSESQKDLVSKIESNQCVLICGKTTVDKRFSIMYACAKMERDMKDSICMYSWPNWGMLIGAKSMHSSFIQWLRSIIHISNLPENKDKRIVALLHDLPEVDPVSTFLALRTSAPLLRIIALTNENFDKIDKDENLKFSFDYVGELRSPITPP